MSSRTAIIISTYGGSEWEALAHERALPSAKAQDVEVLIGHDPNGTVSSVRNALVAKAEDADNIVLLDGDDELAPGYIDAMQRMHAKTSHDETPRLYAPATSYVIRGRRHPPKFWPMAAIEQSNWLVIGTMFPRKLFMQIGGFSANPAFGAYEDYEFWIRCHKAGAQVVKVPEAVYIAHQEPTSRHRGASRNEAHLWHYAIGRLHYPEIYGEEWLRRHRVTVPA